MSRSLRDPGEEQLDYVWRVGRALAWLDERRIIVSRAAEVLHEIAGEGSQAVYFGPSPEEDLVVPPDRSAPALRAAVGAQFLLEDLGEGRELRLARSPFGEQHGLLIPLRTAKAFWGNLVVLGPEPLGQWLDHLEEFAGFVAAGLKWAASLERQRRTASPRSTATPPGYHRTARLPRSLPAPRQGGTRPWENLEDLLIQWCTHPITSLAVLDDKLQVVASAPRPDEALLRVARQAIDERGLARKCVPQALDGPVEVAGEDLSVLLMPALLGEGFLGTVVAGVEADLVSSASSTVADLSQLVVIELLVQDRITQDLEANEREVFVDLLDGRSLGRIIDRAARLGCDLKVGHIPVACRLVRPTRHANPERQMGCLRTILFESFRAGGRATAPRPLCGQTDKNEILAFLPMTDDKDVDALTRSVLRATATLGAIVTVGTGPVCSSPAAFSQNALRARWAARILELTGNPQRGVSFDELGVYALLFDPADPTDLDIFVTRWIGALIEYDRQQNTELTATLEAILEGRGQRQTAEKLLIHLSTLKYRIRRIHEILRLDYHDPEISFNLQLALRIFKARDRLSNAPDETGEPTGPWLPLSSTC